MDKWSGPGQPAELRALTARLALTLPLAQRRLDAVYARELEARLAEPSSAAAVRADLGEVLRNVLPMRYLAAEQTIEASVLIESRREVGLTARVIGPIFELRHGRTRRAGHRVTVTVQAIAGEAIEG